MREEWKPGKNWIGVEKWVMKQRLKRGTGRNVSRGGLWGGKTNRRVKNVVLGRSQETGKREWKRSNRGGKRAEGWKWDKATEKREEGCQWGKSAIIDMNKKNRKEKMRGEG